MKKMLLILMLTTSAFAETYKSTGVIYRLGTVNSSLDNDFIILGTNVETGTCLKSSEGRFMARFRSGEEGDRSYSLALAAYMSGKEVKVAVDDAYKSTDNFCYLKSIEFNPL